MPNFPIIEAETIIQAADKTRLDGSKSFANGADSLTATEIKPHLGASFYDVTVDKFLDWLYPFEIDVVAGANDALDFSEGAGELTATVAPGAYSLSALAAAVKAALDAAGGQVYAVAVSAENVLTISAPAAFSLLIESGSNAAVSLYSAIGFSGEDVAGALTYSGAEIEVIERTATVRTTSDPGAAQVTKSKVVRVISERADHLFSDDDYLRRHEHDILKYVPDGRASFKDIHRRAQELIMSWFDTQGFVDYQNEKITHKRIKDIEEVRQWATVVALRLVFENVSNAVDDIFAAKSKRYGALELQYRDRAVLRLDLNQDGSADVGEQMSVRSAIVRRR